MARRKKSAKKEKRAPSKPPVPMKKRRGFFTYLEAISFKYQLLLGIGLLVIALCVLYPELAFQNKVFMASDTQAATSFAAAVKVLPAGSPNYPLWNPFLFSGMPSFGSLSYLPNIYPVNYIINYLTLGLPKPESFWLLYHIFFLGLGMFLLLRDRGVGFSIAVTAACLMMWMPNHVAVGANGHGSQACAVAYIPFALLLWDRLWRGKGILFNGSALAILLGFQMLRAHLQICYYTYALLGLHFLFFGVLRIRDAARGKPNEEFIPPVFLRRLSRDPEAQSVRTAAFCVGLYAVVLAGIVAASLLLSSVLYIPVHDYAQYSIRGAAEGGGLDYNYATSWSLHPAEMITFFLPHAFGFGKELYYGHMPFTDYPNYLGLIIILGAIGAVCWARSRMTYFLVFIVVVSTLVSFGRFFPVLYDVLFKFLPFFNKFRVPVMILIVQQITVVCLFGIGLNALLKKDSELLKKTARWAMLGSFAVLLFVIVSQGYWSGGFAQTIAGKIRMAQSPQHQLALAKLAGGFLGKDLLKFSILMTLAFVLFFLYTKGALSKGIFIGGLAFLSFFDFYMVDRYIIHPEKFRPSDHYRIVKEAKSYETYLDPGPVVSFLKNEERFFRVLPINYNPNRPTNPLSGDFKSNVYMNSGISSLGGYHPAKLANYQEFLGALGRALASGRFQVLDMMNVRYLLTDHPLPEMDMFAQRWEGLDKSGRNRFIYENLRALPRVFFVDSYLVAEGKAALERLLTSNVDVSRTALLEKRPSIEPVSSSGSRAEIKTYFLNEIHIDAHVESACILILSEVFFPHWKVFINDAPGEIIQANYILRAVALPPGDHKIVFRYDASLFKRGIFISVLTFAVLIITISISLILSVRRRIKWKNSS